MSIKKLLIFLLVGLFGLALVACDKAESESSLDSAKAGEPLETEEGEAVTEPAEGEFTDSLAAKEADQDFIGQAMKAEEVDGVKVTPAIDFALRDQHGVRHSLKDFEGKVVVLNFWQSWCPPCRAELPDFEKVYKDLGENADDVVILGVASPAGDQQIFRQEQKSDEELKGFLEESGISFPTLMDYTGEFYAKHNIMAFPTTVIIRPDGNYYGVVPGALSEANLIKLIDEAKGATN